MVKLFLFRAISLLCLFGLLLWESLDGGYKKDNLETGNDFCIYFNLQYFWFLLLEWKKMATKFSFDFLKDSTFLHAIRTSSIRHVSVFVPYIT